MTLPPLQVERSTTVAPRPIYITGVPRCGSSWVGQLLGALPSVRYVYEPFNLQWVPLLRGELSHFKYLEAGDSVSDRIERTVDHAFAGGQSLKQWARAVYRGYTGSSFGRFDQILIKDPTAPLLCQWLEERYSAQPVIIVRHPCGFASSVDRLGWTFDIQYFLRQRKLMRRHLEGYEDLLRRCSNDLWMTRAAVWAVIHKVLLAQSADSEMGWKFCHYEDLCANPFREFEGLARHLGLEFSPGATRIERLSGNHSPDPGSTYKDSRKMPDIWRERLSKVQIDTVMGVCEEFGLADYPGDFHKKKQAL